MINGSRSLLLSLRHTGNSAVRDDLRVGVVILSAMLSLGVSLRVSPGRPDPVTRAGAVTPVAVTGLIWLQSFPGA